MFSKFPTRRSDIRIDIEFPIVPKYTLTSGYCWFFFFFFIIRKQTERVLFSPEPNVRWSRKVCAEVDIGRSTERDTSSIEG